MKSVKFNLCILGIILVGLPINMLAQGKEIPVTTSSKEALSLFITGRDKLENFENADAAALFEKAIQKDPNFAQAYLYRSQSGGGTNVFRQNLDKAVSHADKASAGEKMLIHYFQAQADGKGQKQKELLDELLKSFPDDKRVQTIAGIYYYGFNDFANALDHFAKAAEIDNTYATAYNMIGYCESALEKYPEAERAFQTLIKLNPDKANSYDSYAELLLKQGKYDESIVQYKLALEKDPSFAFSLIGIGNNNIFKGDYAGARKYYQEYYDKAPSIDGKLNAMFLKATSFVYENKIDDAIRTLDVSRSLAEKEKLASSAIFSYANQGFILTESGNPAEGMKYYDKAIQLIETSNLPEGSKDNFNTFSKMWRFYYLTANNELDKATVVAEKCKEKVASRKNPNEEMLLNSQYAFLEIKKGNFDKAIAYISKADNEDPLNWYYAALAYSKKGDKQNASMLYAKIKKCNINSINLALVRKRAMEKSEKGEMETSR